MTVLDSFRTKDTDFLNLRKAARATVVAVPLFALLKISLGLGAISTFAFFACFVGLVFGDYGGPPRNRALAYTTMILLGDIVIVIGSLLSSSLAAGAAAMFVIMFAASFATVFGGYTPVLVAPVALAYSLAVLDPLSNVAIDLRVIGWSIGGTAALLAALLLWPVDRRLRLRQTLAEASAGLGDMLASLRDAEAAEAAYKRAFGALTAARRKASAPLRPAGPTSHDLGLLHLVQNLEQAMDLCRRVLDGGWTPHFDDQLADACAQSFRRTGALVLKEADPRAVAEDLQRLDQALLTRQRTADLQAIQKATTQSDAEDSGASAMAGMRRSFPIMALAHVAVWVEASAATALGAGTSVNPVTISPELAQLSDRPKEVLGRARRILSRGLDPDGVVFRNSIRAAAAMTLAAVLAKLVPVEHGFWITLGALLVLRSSAASTSATALQAAAGTLIGFVVAGAILKLFGSSSAVLWSLLPICVFFAGYTPGVVSFMVGQVSFTTMVVVLFTLIDNAGIVTDVARLETVTLGAASGMVMSLILWPRGARVALARAIAVVYRASSEGLRLLVTGSAEVRREAESRMHDARRRVDEAFGVALSERGQKIDTGAWMALFRAPNMAHSLLTGLLPEPTPWLAERCNAAIAATLEHRDAVASSFDRVADRLDPATAPARRPPAETQRDDLTPLLMDCFESVRPFGPDRVDGARLLIAWNEWLTHLDDYIVKAEPALVFVAAVSKPRNWLRWSVPRSKGASGDG